MKYIKFILVVLLMSSLLTETLAETEASTIKEMEKITTNEQVKKTPDFNQKNKVQTQVELKQTNEVITPVLKTKDSILYDTQSYDIWANFVTGTDENGDVIDKNNPHLKISGYIDMKTPGYYTQTVTYTYNGNQTVNSDFVVTVKKDQTTIVANPEIYMYRDKNTKVKIEEAVAKATDKDGKELTTYETVNGWSKSYGNLFIEGEWVGLTVPQWATTTHMGNYLFVKNANGEEIQSKLFNIKVIIDRTNLSVNDIKLYQGAKFDIEKTFKSATDIKGNKLEFKDVYYTPSWDQPAPSKPGDSYHTIDTSKPGYQHVVMFIYDSNNKQIGDIASVEVKKDYTWLKTKDVTINKGEKYDASMGYVSGIDKDGKSLKFDEGMCWPTEGIEVNPNKGGVYHVTYGVKNGIGKLITQERTVTVIDEDDQDKEINVIIPTKMLFSNTESKGVAKEIDSNNYAIINNSEKVALNVTLDKIEEIESAGLKLLTESDVNPSMMSNSLRLNLWVNNKITVKSLSSRTKDEAVAVLNSGEEADMRLKGLYFASIEESVKKQPKYSLVFKFQVKK